VNRLALGLFLVLVCRAYAPPPKAAPALDTSKPNSNALLKAHKDNVTASASTTYNGYSANSLIDGDEQSTWYSESNDTATVKGNTPWVKIAFPTDVMVRRVTVLGSRDPNYPSGYFVLAGKLELLDEKGKVLFTKELKAAGEKNDFEFVTGNTPNVRSIKFTITDDQGDKNGSRDCALSEIQVE